MAAEKKPKDSSPSRLSSTRMSGIRPSSLGTKPSRLGSKPATLGSKPATLEKPGVVKPEKDNKKKKSGGGKGLLILLIILLLGGNGYVYWIYNDSKKNNDALSKNIEALKVEKIKIGNELQETLKVLEAQKGQSAKKDSLIAVIRQDLTSRKDKIDELLGKISWYQSQNRKLKAAAGEIEQFREMKKYYFSAIDSLTQANRLLNSEKDSLSARLAAFVSSGGVLEEEGYGEEEVMEETVERLYTQTFTVSGLYLKKQKEIETNKAKKVEEIKICFSLEEDEGINEGEKEIFVRIIGPDGATIAIDSEGSGRTIDAETGEEQPYSFSYYIEYPLLDPTHCTYKDKITNFKKGRHKFELYYNGYLMGKKSLTLK